MPSRKSVHPSTYQEVSNRNFLSVVGFKFLLNRCPKVDFYCNSANIPEVTLGTAIQRTYLKDIPVPGDKMTYGDLGITFMVDEDMENYLQIYQLITSLGYPESLGQFDELKDTDSTFIDNLKSRKTLSEESRSRAIPEERMVEKSKVEISREKEKS